MKVFVNDVTVCAGCYQCQIACKDEHCANDWTPYAKPQPDTGHFWLKLNEYVRGQVPHVKMSYVVLMCQHCENPPCIEACKVEAIYKRDDGLVVIDPKKCTGCQLCLDANACPYGVIYFNEASFIAQKCTGCAHLMDRGWREPRCADVCANLALRYGEESGFDLTNSEALYPELGLNTKVRYIGLPKRFIAGTVYDPGTKEVIIGASCTLSGGGNFNATTDELGDFWLEGLPAAEFTLKIEAGGKNKTIEVSTVEKDIGLGDIALS